MYSISIHSPHTRGDTRLAVQSHRWAISIHSPHTRGDSYSGFSAALSLNFNPLPSYEGRHNCNADRVYLSAFQSTPLIRGETGAGLRQFYQSNISIHSPHTRGDFFFPFPSYHIDIFQSTPLIRGETKARYMPAVTQAYFNPLPSYEGRLELARTMRRLDRFQSTPLMRGETA